MFKLDNLRTLYDVLEIKPKRECETWEDCPYGYSHSCNVCDIKWKTVDKLNNLQIVNGLNYIIRNFDVSLRFDGEYHLGDISEPTLADVITYWFVVNIDKVDKDFIIELLR